MDKEHNANAAGISKVYIASLSDFETIQTSSPNNQPKLIELTPSPDSAEEMKKREPLKIIFEHKAPTEPHPILSIPVKIVQNNI